jgi:iron-sulfur cluster assembly protein|tara:strand:- start:374 stop:706 length:333 start_codon:yes stop_codon:yes gene_type:complete
MTIQLTSSAAEEAKKYMDKHDNDSKQYLRVGVNGGGCSGFEYNITIDQKYDEEKDTMVHQYGIDIIVDRKSALYLDGTILDYHNAFDHSGFTFNNPNAVKSCGCGSSFQA